MSQVSPDGRYVVTTINEPGKGQTDYQRRQAPEDLRQNYYVANFKDYRLLQVFYPTRGVLAWYSKATGLLQPLPGADDPRYVQASAVWSPDGKYLVFARAEAKDAYPPGAPLAERSNDPNETQVRYDLYRIPFDDGRGGKPEPIAGASANGVEQQLREGLARRSFHRLREGEERPADASGRQALHRAGAGRRGAPDALQHAAHELVAQLLAERALAGLLVEEPLAVHAAVPDAPRPERQRHAGRDDREQHRREPRGEHPGVRQRPAGRPARRSTCRWPSTTG